MQNGVTRWILITLAVISGAYLLYDHGQHLLPYLPFISLLGCLGMHFFMHQSHGHGHEKATEHPTNRTDPVCGMQVANEKIAVQYNGMAHFFCSNFCRDQFLKEPNNYGAH